MPITVKLTFPSGRYHATPWGRHVNEGVPEWPPSPWRLLRALIAVWRRTCRDLPEDRIRHVLASMLEPPRFRLPSHRVAHTRHYMPLNKKSPVELGGGGTSLVFDTFVVVDRKDAALVGWPDRELPADDREVLARLLRNLNWLGRAESWVHASLSEEEAEWSCIPASPSDVNPVGVFCPDPETAFGGEHYPSQIAKRLKKGLKPGELLFDCPRWHLCLDTQTIHDRRWPRVPGARWVNYQRPVETTVLAHASGRRRTMPTLARFALDGPVLPLTSATLLVSERMRAGLLSNCRHLLGQEHPRDTAIDLHSHAPALWGKDRDERPLTGHQHAFILPADEDGDGRLDHVTIHAAMGLNALERLALGKLRRLVLREEQSVQFLLIGCGSERDFRAPLLETANDWVSATPFVVTRHMKDSGRKRDPRAFFEAPDGRMQFVRQVLAEELQRRGLFQEGMGIDPLPDGGAHRLRAIQFWLNRRKAGDDGASRPRGLFRIRFPRPVSGPIALGHSCHFGLGLFVPG